jgi:hypothetical protein
MYFGIFRHKDAVIADIALRAHDVLLAGSFNTQQKIVSSRTRFAVSYI